MRRIGLLIVCLLCVAMLPVVSFAQTETTYVLDAVEMTITIPSAFTVITEETLADVAKLESLGLTEEYMRDYMSQHAIYLDAISEDGKREIVVTMDESSQPNYGSCDDAVLLEACSAIEKELSLQGLVCSDHEIFRHAQTKFIRSDISQAWNGSTAYGVEYNTAFEGKAINVTMHSYSGVLDAADRKILEEIVDSIVFLNAPEAENDPSAEAKAFDYSDAETDAKFTVPAGWKQVSLSGEREIVKAKFASANDGEALIIYGSKDIWEKLSEAEKVGQTRADYDQSVFSTSDIAGTYGVPITDVSVKQYGAYEYYIVPVSTTVDVAGTGLTVRAIHALRMGNGCMYQFQFMGSEDSQYYRDFEAMLSSAEYKGEGDREVPVAATKSSDTKPNDKKPDVGGSFLLSVIITVAVYSLPVILYRYVVRKSPVEKKQARRITIIYGIVAFILMSLLVNRINGEGVAGGAIVLWSFINYKILTGGDKKDPDARNDAAAADDKTQNGRP